MSTLMFWNKQNNNNNTNNNNAGGNNQTNDSKSGKRNWLHAPDVLINGHVVYLVKFLGNTPVDQPKGIDVVKDAIRRLQFAQEMKKAETGTQMKMQKLEITISVDGVAVQEPRTQKILHQFPLHNISYCADEKGVKKFFSFIAKHPAPANNLSNGINSNNSNNSRESSSESHECFVFVSSKLASDITLTIGQAFDLAYRRYMNDSEKSTEMSKVQTQNKELEAIVSVYKNRLKDISELLSKSELDRFLKRLDIQDILEMPKSNRLLQNNNVPEHENDNKLLLDTTTTSKVLPTVPPRTLHNQINSTLDSFISSSQKMGELLLNSDSDSDFDPRAEESVNGNKVTNDLFGFEPSMNNSIGTHSFTNNLNNNINNLNNNNILNLNNGNIDSVGHLPPLLAPPPVKSRRSVTTNSNGGTQADLFGSIPFSANHPPSILDEKFNKTDAMLSDFTLESLDPLRK